MGSNVLDVLHLAYLGVWQIVEKTVTILVVKMAENKCMYESYSSFLGKVFADFPNPIKLPRCS